jgi:hypothetical protein
MPTTICGADSTAVKRNLHRADSFGLIAKCYRFHQGRREAWRRSLRYARGRGGGFRQRLLGWLVDHYRAALISYVEGLSALPGELRQPDRKLPAIGQRSNAEV